MVLLLMLFLVVDVLVAVCCYYLGCLVRFGLFCLLGV